MLNKIRGIIDMNYKDIFPALAGFFLPEFMKNVAQAPGKEVGEQIANMINLLCTPITMAKMYQEHWLEKFGNSLDSKLSKIPPENLTEPQIYLLGPIFEASKYYYEKAEFREMFACLAAASCDTKKLPSVHPSFIEIIKQLSSFDAQLLSMFRKESTISVSASMAINGKYYPPVDPPQPCAKTIQEYIYPIVQVYLVTDDGMVLLQKDIFLESNTDNVELIASSINNLCRLGLLEVDYTRELKEEKYNKFYVSDFYKSVISNYTKSGRDKNSNEIGFVNIRGHRFWANSFNDVKLKKGIVQLTQYGYDFSKICIIDEYIKPVIN